MPTKTDRILSYLPGTFRALPKPTALYAVVDAFGNELLDAENSLAALMLAHWVDHADKGAEFIQDLACIAALYGLAPRSAVAQDQPGDSPICPPLTADESVEEFRAHLKRYVRTFLDGTVTVQGVLRIVAEALGLHIDDDYAAIDTWWRRRDDRLTSIVPRGEDAAALLFGRNAVSARGQASRPARVAGRATLRGPIDLRGAAKLRLKIDAGAPVDIDLAQHIEDLSAATLTQIATAITNTIGTPIARVAQNALVLTSPTLGTSSRLEVLEIDGDAAPQLLGLLPHSYRGAAATAARVTGTVDLSGEIDLGEARYLRLLLDGTRLVELDCSGTSLAGITDKINAAFDEPIASHDGRFLTLTSPTTGFGSSIAFQPPAAQDATERLFGPILTFYAGSDPRPARVTGARDLSAGIDLSGGSMLRVRIDDGPSITIDCRGENPARTSAIEIVARLNSVLGLGAAALDGNAIRLSSPTAGPDSALVFETLPTGEDAADTIFGIGPRVFHGTAARNALLIGSTDLGEGVDLRARHILRVGLDGGPPVEVDLRAGLDNAEKVNLDIIAGAINRDVKHDIAWHADQHLVLGSPTAGGISRVAIEPLEQRQERRFVSRAFITDDASQALFGFVAREAAGEAATQARMLGAADLSRGVDLREARFLRVSIDGRPPRDIDCATNSPRPRAAQLPEIVKAINEQLDAEIASHDGQRLVLTSPSEGITSTIAFDPRAADALDRLIGLAPGVFRGRDATRVSFVGAADLSAGIDLAAGAAVKLGIDGEDAIEIALTGAEPARRSLNDIVLAINLAIPSIASSDGTHVVLRSAKSGVESQLEFAVPSGLDATVLVFGIAAPREYHGAAAAPATIDGRSDLSDQVDLRTTRFLRLAVDGKDPQNIDCTSRVPEPRTPASLEHVTLEQIAGAINDQLGEQIATHGATSLRLESGTPGAASRLELLPFTAADAREKLLGDTKATEVGSDPKPAVITGQADLLAAIDLDERRIVRLAVDGERPVDIDVHGAAPSATFAEEVVDRINAVFPGLASVTDDDHLRLTSPTAGAESRLALLPLRALEILEYPPEPTQEPPRAVRHGEHWFVDNVGVAEGDLKIELSAPNGVAGPTVLNRTTGQRIRLMVILMPGERIQLWRDPVAGLRAVIIATDGSYRPVPPQRILAGPLGAQARVPFDGEWQLSGGVAAEQAALLLNNPLAPSVVELRARTAGAAGNNIAVAVVKADLAGLAATPIVATDQPIELLGIIQTDGQDYRLENAAGATLVQLRLSTDIQLNEYHQLAVSVHGPIYSRNGDPPLMVVERIDALFDVTIHDKSGAGDPNNKPYRRVTIGAGMGPGSLAYSIVEQESPLVRAAEHHKAGALTLPLGRSEWVFLDCYSARFDRDRFDQASFAGGLCRERGVFDVSRFARTPPECEVAVFAHAGPPLDPPVEVRMSWSRHRPGRFVVHLPADLPAQFGGRFNDARFGRAGDQPEEFNSVVTEPPDDDDHLVKRVHQHSTLVTAEVVTRVPLGFTALSLPIRRPRTRTLSGGQDGGDPVPGDPDSGFARMFLTDPDVPGFIKLMATKQGAWGNAIAVSVRKSGPAFYDVTIAYQGARFENARLVALAGQVSPETAAAGNQLPALVEDLLRPGPVGVLHAKAAGIQAEVTRDRT